MALYSLTIARALRTVESSSYLRVLEEKRECFWIFYYVNMSTKAKVTVNVSLLRHSVKFCKIWQIGSKYLSLVEACFLGKSISRAFKFCSGKGHKFEKNRKHCLDKPYFFAFK